MGVMGDRNVASDRSPVTEVCGHKFSGETVPPVRADSADPGSGVDPTSLPNHPVERVVYLVGNPWPLCADCRGHVYLVEDTGEWRHFAPLNRRCQHCGAPLRWNGEWYVWSCSEGCEDGDTNGGTDG